MNDISKMNGLELRQLVDRLKRKKKINEANISEADLQGKYKVSYTALCEELKVAQAELKIRYMTFLREMGAILSDAVYADPDSEYAAMRERFLELDCKNGGDPLLRKVMTEIGALGDGIKE